MQRNFLKLIRKRAICLLSRRSTRSRADVPHKGGTHLSRPLIIGQLTQLVNLNWSQLIDQMGFLWNMHDCLQQSKVIESTLRRSRISSSAQREVHNLRRFIDE